MFQKHRTGWIIWGLAFVFLLTYVGSYIILSRRGFELADQYDMDGFYFFWPENTGHWRRAECTARFFYCPLIYVDKWLGTGRLPGSEPLWRLSHAIGSPTPQRVCSWCRSHWIFRKHTGRAMRTMMYSRDSDKAGKTVNANTEALVPHPRFGSEPRPSGNLDAVAAAQKDWGGEYFREVVFPESAIPADPAKQNYSLSPRKYYVDTKKRCRDCGRSFLFFAEEQRHWYEQLGFPLAADCVRCPACRKADRIVRLRFNRYSENITKHVLDDDSLATLVDDAVFLWEQSILKDMEKIYRLRKTACCRIPDHEVTRKIKALISSQRSRDEA